MNSHYFPNLSKYDENEIQSLIKKNGEPIYHFRFKKYFVISLISVGIIAISSQFLQGKKRYYAYTGAALSFGLAIGSINKQDKKQQLYEHIEAKLQSIRDERILVLRTLLWLTNADGKFTDEEEAILESLAREMEINNFHCRDEISNLPSNIKSLLKKIQSSEAKQFLTKQIIHLCYSDGIYDAFERKALLEIAAGLNQTPKFIEEIEVQYAREHLQPKIQEQTQEQTCEAIEEQSQGWNWKKSALIGGLSIAGGLAVAATGGMAAPAIGGLIGSQIMGLSGAAAVSAGTAALGFGSLASGGLGMAGGTAVVSTIFGGIGGLSVANSLRNLTGDLEEFGLIPASPVNEERNACHSLICIHGFLQQGMSAPEEWVEVSDFYQNSHILSLSWESKKLSDLTKILSDSTLKLAFQKGFSIIAKSGLKAAGGMIALPLGILQSFSIIDNPWSVAKDRSEKAGIALGKYIAMMKSPISLLGYSLGSRVIVYALQYLHENEIYGKVFDVYLLAGAVSTNSKILKHEALRKVVANNIFNVYTKEDLILQYLYRGVSLGDEPIGITPLKDQNLINIDCTEFVKGHLDYPRKLGKILKYCGAVND